MNAPLAAERIVYKIRPDVSRFKRDHAIILVAKNGSPVRVSPIAEKLLPLLASGARFEDLSERLKSLYPKAEDIALKLSKFLDQLASSGLLDSENKQTHTKQISPRLRLFNPDPAAHLVARMVAVVPAPVGWFILFAAIAGSCTGIGGLALYGPEYGVLPHPLDLFRKFDLTGLLIFVLVMVPLHEAAHAVASRLAGAKVGKAGILFHGWVVPGPFIETPYIYQITGRWRRFWIPAAGPLVDLATAGASAWVLLLTDATANAQLHAAMSCLFLLSVIFLYLDTNPLSPSDGSRMLEAVLDDELARRSALSKRRSKLSHWRVVSWYRVACMAHLQTAVIVVFLWWD